MGTFFKFPSFFRKQNLQAELKVVISNLSKANISLQQKNTELDELKMKLMSTQEQLIQSQKLESVGKLAVGIAHDFNNILAGILGYASILLEKFKNTDIEAVKKLDIIVRSAKRGAGMTRQLLKLTRQKVFEKINLNLNDIVKEATGLLSSTIDKTIVVRENLQPNLWPIDADATQMLQIFMNLGVNARDAMPLGGELIIETKNIVLDSAYCNLHPDLMPGEYVQVSIQDTGFGIPKNLQKRIFDPFFTTKKEGAGSGLGLSMVYGIMRSHGGTISVTSESGNGTTFDLYLPKAGSHTSVSQDLLAVSSPQQVKKVLEGKRILVVDDEQMIRDLIGEILQKAGALTVFAVNGEEALEALEKNPRQVDMVLLDIMMPKMDGMQAYHEMRDRYPKLKVMFATGYTENKEIMEFRKHEKVDFIQKPFMGEELLVHLEKLATSSAERTIH